MGRRAPWAGLGLAFGLASLAWPRHAHAGGPTVVDPGTAPLARGGAFVARADDLSAFFHNPAGLSKTRRPALSLGANFSNLQVEHTRAGTGALVSLLGEDCTMAPASPCIFDPAVDPDAGDAAFGAVRNEWPITPLPQVVVHWGNVGRIPGLSLSVGADAPQNLGVLRFSEDGAQRYVATQRTAARLRLGAAIAYQVNEYFSFGILLSNTFHRLTTARAIRGALAAGDPDGATNEDRAGDGRLAVAGTDLFSPSASVGFQSRPIRPLEVGVAFHLPTWVNATGSVDFSAPGDDTTATLAATSSTQREVLPPRIAAGARYIHCRFDVELDYVFEAWSTYRELEITLDDDTYNTSAGALELRPLSATRDYRGTHSVRLGGTVVAVPNALDVSIGGSVNTSPHKRNPETVTVDTPWGLSGTVGGGLGIRAGQRAKFDLSYARLIQGSLDGSAGTRQQLGGLATDAANVGNLANRGSYALGGNLFGASVQVNF